MSHPMYRQAQRLMGMPVEVRMRDGNRFQGRITGVTPEFMNFETFGRPISGESMDEVKAQNAVGDTVEQTGTEIQFFRFRFRNIAAIIFLAAFFRRRRRFIF